MYADSITGSFRKLHLDEPPTPGESDDDWENADVDAVVAKAASALEKPQNKPQQRKSDAAAPVKDDLPSAKVSQQEPLPFHGAHILELHNLTKKHTTGDIEELVQGLRCTIPPTIKWVDDNHALLLFSDPKAVRTAQQRWPEDSDIKSRPFIEACTASKDLPTSDLQPAKPRQATTDAVARRMIGSALGLKLHNRDGEAKLAEQRRQKQAAKKAPAKGPAADEAWEDG